MNVYARRLFHIPEGDILWEAGVGLQSPVLIRSVQRTKTRGGHAMSFWHLSRHAILASVFCFLFVSTGCEDEQTRLPVCGDGVLEQWENCDDGNTDDQDECTAQCQVARCGDGIARIDLQPGDHGFEACDDGNEINEDGCLN